MEDNNTTEAGIPFVCDDHFVFIGSGESGAVFNPEYTHRYSLWRRWCDDLNTLNMAAFIGLNPSTADAEVDDPTVRRCIQYAKDWGFDGMFMINIFSFRATIANDMKAAAEPIGQFNDHAIHEVVKNVPLTVCAWGTHGGFKNRQDDVKDLLRNQKLTCLKKTKHGFPNHPLYLKKSLKPIKFE